MAHVVFPTGQDASIFWGAYALWVVSEVVGAGIIPRLRQRGDVMDRKDRGSRYVIGAGVFFSVWLAFAFASSGIDMLPGSFFILGVSLIVTGVAIRQWAIATLGRFFSLTVRIAGDHRVVTSGPTAGSATPPTPVPSSRSPAWASRCSRGEGRR